MNLFEEYECVKTIHAGNAIEFTVGKLVRDEELNDEVLGQFKSDYEAAIRKYLDSGTGIVEVRIEPGYFVHDFPMYNRTGTHIRRNPLTNLWARYNIGTKCLTARCRIWREGGIVPDGLTRKEGESLPGLPRDEFDENEDYLGFGVATDDDTMDRVRKYIEENNLIWAR